LFVHAVTDNVKLLTSSQVAIREGLMHCVAVRDSDTAGASINLWHILLVCRYIFTTCACIGLLAKSFRLVLKIYSRFWAYFHSARWWCIVVFLVQRWSSLSFLSANISYCNFCARSLARSSQIKPTMP